MSLPLSNSPQPSKIPFGVLLLAVFIGTAVAGCMVGQTEPVELTIDLTPFSAVGNRSGMGLAEVFSGNETSRISWKGDSTKVESNWGNELDALPIEIRSEHAQNGFTLFLDVTEMEFFAVNTNWNDNDVWAYPEGAFLDLNRYAPLMLFRLHGHTLVEGEETPFYFLGHEFTATLVGPHTVETMAVLSTETWQRPADIPYDDPEFPGEPPWFGNHTIRYRYELQGPHPLPLHVMMFSETEYDEQGGWEADGSAAGMDIWEMDRLESDSDFAGLEKTDLLPDRIRRPENMEFHPRDLLPPGSDNQILPFPWTEALESAKAEENRVASYFEDEPDAVLYNAESRITFIQEVQPGVRAGEMVNFEFLGKSSDLRFMVHKPAGVEGVPLTLPTPMYWVYDVEVTPAGFNVRAPETPRENLMGLDVFYQMCRDWMGDIFGLKFEAHWLDIEMDATYLGDHLIVPSPTYTCTNANQPSKSFSIYANTGLPAGYLERVDS